MGQTGYRRSREGGIDISGNVHPTIGNWHCIDVIGIVGCCDPWQPIRDDGEGFLPNVECFRIRGAKPAHGEPVHKCLRNSQCPKSLRNDLFDLLSNGLECESPVELRCTLKRFNLGLTAKP